MLKSSSNSAEKAKAVNTKRRDNASHEVTMVRERGSLFARHCLCVHVISGCGGMTGVRHKYVCTYTQFVGVAPATFRGDGDGGTTYRSLYLSSSVFDFAANSCITVHIKGNAIFPAA